MGSFLGFKRLAPVLGFCLVIIAMAGCESKGNDDTGNGAVAADDEWKLLFDGETTAGWRARNGEGAPAPGWTVADGALLVHAREDSTVKAGDIITEAEYGNFILEWDWKMLSKGGNSGVKYFVKDEEAEGSKYGPGLEYQILDDANHPWMLEGKMQPGDFHTVAALYEIYPATSRPVKPLGEWNNSRIVVKGKQVEHWLNDVKVLAYERGSDDFKERVAKSKFAKHENYGEAGKGHILLQDHGSKMAFRNIRIKEL